MKILKNDKVKHFVFGLLFAVAGTIVTSWWCHLDAAALSGFLAAVLAGMFKDIVLDRWFGLGTFDQMDIVWTVLGGAAGAAGTFAVYQAVI